MVTPEMKIALDALRRMGVEFHPTRHKTLDCGCFVLGGWETTTPEPGIRVRSCCPDHADAYRRAIARWNDPDVDERFRDVEAHLAMAELLREEIGA